MGTFEQLVVIDKITNKKQYNKILPSNKIKEDRITKPQNDHTQEILAIIRNKYLRKRRAKNNVEGIQGPINKTDLYEYKGPYASKSYLKQIKNRRNPIGKPLGNNNQLIANVYTGNPQLPILPRRLQGIRRPKALLKQGEYSLPSSLQRGANEKYKLNLPGEYNEHLIMQKGSSGAYPINLINYKKDLQGLKIQPKSILPTINHK